MRRCPSGVQLVNFQRLQLKGQQPSAGVALLKKDSSVYLLPALRHSKHLVKALRFGYVAIFTLAPLYPGFLYLLVKGFAAGPCPKRVAVADYVPAVCPDHAVRHVAVPL